ncbi:MAG: hypothetical protein HY335_05960 [Deinococcus sp.]|nr:hypothetical protein [Deinococcus sp.]
MHRWQVWVLVVGLLGSWGASRGAAQMALGVSPARVELEVAPGMVYAGTLVVRNQGDEAGVVAVSLADFLQFADGSMAMVSPGTAARSLAAYLTYSPASFLLSPGEQQLVRFSLALPPDAQGSYYSLVVLGPEPPLLSGSDMRFSVVPQVAVALYAAVAGTQLPAGEIVGLAVDWQEGQLVAQVTFQNSGNVPLRPGGRLVVLDGVGVVVWEQEIPPSLTLPQVARERLLPLGTALAPGQYVAVVTLEYQSQALVVGEAVFSVPE